MIEPTVLLSSDVAVLAYDLWSFIGDDRHSGCIVRKYINWIRSEQWKIIHTHWSFVLPDKWWQNGNGRIFSSQEDAGILRSHNIPIHTWIMLSSTNSLSLYLCNASFRICGLLGRLLYVIKERTEVISDLFGIKLLFVIFIINIVTLPAINTYK